MTENLLKQEAVESTASVKKLSAKELEIQRIQKIHETTVSTVEVGNRVGRTTEFISDYTKFKNLEGNRDVEPNPELLKDLKTFGQLSPVIVKTEGDKLLILNGQHRLFHLKELGHPVEVLCISEGFSGNNFDAVKSLNVTSKNWTKNDYSKHYIKDGNSNFVEFANSISKFKNLKPAIIYSQVNGSKGNLSELFKNGQLKFNPSQSDIQIMERLDELIGAVVKSRKDNKQTSKNNYLDRLNLYNALKKFLEENLGFDFKELKRILEEKGFKLTASVIANNIAELCQS